MRILNFVWARVALLYMAIFGLSVALILGLVLYIGQKVLTEQLRARVYSEVNFLRYEYAEDGLAELLEETEERIEKSGFERRLQYVIQSPQGDTIFDDFEVDRELLGWQLRRVLGDDGNHYEFIFYFEKFDNGYILGVGSDLSVLTDFRAAVLRGVLLTLLAALALSAACGLMLGAYVSSQIKKVNLALQQVAKGRLDTRLDLRSGGYEFERMSTELNNVFQKVDSLLTNLKHVSRGLAHDLRTPLAVIKNRLNEVAQHQDTPEPQCLKLEQVDQDLDGVLRYLESVLLISELDSGELSSKFSAVNLSDLTQEMWESYAPLFEDAELIAEVSIVRGISVQGHAALLQRLLANLLDNVLLHSGGAGKLSLELTATDKRVALVLSNNITPQNPNGEKSGHLGETHTRYGMGLKIAQAVAHLHSGTLLTDRQENVYLCRLALPRRSPAA